VKTEARGRAVDEWKAKPGNPDNHWLDCLVGCAVAASMQGAVLFGTDQKKNGQTTIATQRDTREATLNDEPRGLGCPRCGCRHPFVVHTRAKSGHILRVGSCQH